MLKQVLSPKTKNILALLVKDGFFKKVYLAGGTALALQLGHRLSFDLDFYINDKFNENQILERLKQIGNFKEETVDWQTILGNFPGIKFSLFYYQYPLIKKLKSFQGIAVASLEDIGGMKIAAVSSRGTKRDFIDLYFLIKHGFSIRKMLQFYDQKYNNLKDLYHHIIKSLIYFEDADKEKMPQMLVKCDWRKIKKYFLVLAPKLLDEELKKIK